MIVKDMIDCAAAIGATDVVVADSDASPVEAGFAAYFVEEVRRYIERAYGVDMLYEDGLRDYLVGELAGQTTLPADDPFMGSMQGNAEEDQAEACQSQPDLSDPRATEQAQHDAD